MIMDFWDIYNKHYERVRKFVFALVKDEWAADDLIQETFIKVQKNLNQLRDETMLSSWIFRISYNLCQDHFRKKTILEKECTFEVDERNVLVCDPVSNKN